MHFKAQVNIEDGAGSTPLLAAALNGEDDCLKMLIEAGAVVTHQNFKGYTPLMKAAQNGHPICVRMLCIAGDNHRCTARRGKTGIEQDACSLAMKSMVLARYWSGIEPESCAVTYPALKEMYVSYKWDAAIGDMGGFRYRNKDGFDEIEPITRENAGKVCALASDSDISAGYCSISQVLGLSKVTLKDLEVFGVNLGMPYGWDHKKDCWTYFTNETSDRPTHYAKYIPPKTGMRKPVLLKRDQNMISRAEQSIREWKHAKLKKKLQNYDDCIKSLKMTSEIIRAQEHQKFLETDSANRELHISTFQRQLHVLKHELEQLVKVSTSELCDEMETEELQDVMAEIMLQFKSVWKGHQDRSSKWYNNIRKYTHMILEMANMKNNALSVPLLSLQMYQEWKSGKGYLRQAGRMMLRESFRFISISFLSHLFSSYV